MGALITNNAFFIIIAAFVVFVLGTFLNLYPPALRRRNEYNRATPASGRIVQVGRSCTSGMWGGQDTDFTMRVMPPNGAPHEVKLTWPVGPLSMQKLKEGAELAIRIDARDANKIYSAEQWAWSWHQTPLRYGNRTPIGYRVR